MLRRYDTLIIDEAHERSLNIDFLLGLPQAAAAAPAGPQAHHHLGHHRPAALRRALRTARRSSRCPGRTLPGRGPVPAARRGPGPDAEVRPRSRDQIRRSATPSPSCAASRPGDMLVFLSGEREIRDTADALDAPCSCPTPRSCRSTPGCRPPSSTGSSPRHRGRRIVLATNVAETSLTVPGIRYVVDPGTARISRYSQRTKVQRLPIEPISQASANQRAGRCGRTVRRHLHPALLARRTSTSRPEFTDPEILRTNLASVILQMAALGLGDVADFPSSTRRTPAQIADGVALLNELGALAAGRARPTGRPARPDRRARPADSAQLPLDPRLGRMIVEADRQRLRARGAGDRRRAVHPGPAGAPGRARSRPPTSSTPGSPTRRRTSSAYLNLWATCASSRSSCPPASSGGCAGPSTCTTCGSGSGRTCVGQLRQIVTRRWASRIGDQPADPDRRSTAACWPGCCPTSGLQGRRAPRLPRAPAARGSRSSRARRCPEAAALGDGGRAGRDHPAVGAG